MKKENFITLPEFLRRVVFDDIRRQQYPELFISSDDSSINSIRLERIARNTQELQDIITQREEIIEEMRSMVSSIHKFVEANALAKELERIIALKMQ